MSHIEPVLFRASRDSNLPPRASDLRSSCPYHHRHLHPNFPSLQSRTGADQADERARVGGFVPSTVEFRIPTEPQSYLARRSARSLTK